MFKKILSQTIIVCFFLTTLGPLPKAHADILNLPAPGTMVSVSPNFEPALIRGLTVHQDNPFLFDFIVDPGQSKLSRLAIKNQSDRMIKYFFASLTMPDKDVWVNLSPYEKDRMVPEALGKTAMGRDLLAQDYMLKQLTASLIYPQRALGRMFWAKVYAKAKEIYGTTEIPVNTFNKVWIVPQRVGIYEHGQTAFILDGHLKVMLEEDYLSLTKHNAISNLSPSNEVKNQAHTFSSQIIRSIVLPEIEKEINGGKNFATLRQIFYAQALAVWFKNNLKQALLNRVYANKGTVKGIDQNNKATNEAIYHQYLKAYKKGVFNFIQEDLDPVTQETLPRKYFSGGYDSKAMLAAERVTTELPSGAEEEVTTEIQKFSDVLVAIPESKEAAIGLNRTASAAMTIDKTDDIFLGELLGFFPNMIEETDGIVGSTGAHIITNTVTPSNYEGLKRSKPVYKYVIETDKSTHQVTLHEAPSIEEILKLKPQAIISYSVSYNLVNPTFRERMGTQEDVNRTYYAFMGFNHPIVMRVDQAMSNGPK